MRISTAIIKELKPCKDRLENYLKHYQDFDGTLEDFILLDKITYNDKVWVFNRLASKEQNVKWALLCASSILHIFEDKFPNDKRPRVALEAIEAWLNNPTKENAANAANDAAYAAANAAYAANAYSAAYAAYAAYAAANAANAANAAAYAAYAAANAAAVRINQEEVNLMFMIDALKESQK